VSGGSGRLGLFSGVGLVAANMIGAGVFVSAGFLSQQLGPGAILLAWTVGAALALCGAVAYGQLARAVPRSGGEYRFLSELLHPFAGYLAGWTSLLVGFSAPIAASALAAGHFVRTLRPSASPLAVAAVLIVLLTVLHAAGFRMSARTQNALVAAKAALLIAFLAIGLAQAPLAWPDWRPPEPPASLPAAFATSLLFVSFAFSGWNAAVYAAGEFREPRRDVPRAMVVGCALVALLYLGVNWVFVASLTPEQAAVAATYETHRVTLGHLVMRRAVGAAGAAAMSALTVVALVSSMSAMVFAGPRVYAAMAHDGFLPRALSGRDGRPTRAAIALQGGLALVVLLTHSLQDMLMGLGAILTVFSALTACALLRARSTRPDLPRSGSLPLVAASVYVAASLALLGLGMRASLPGVLWLFTAVAVAGGAFAFSQRRRGRQATPLT
jgi:APA family basic amino acid/polyamine antiporter